MKAALVLPLLLTLTVPTALEAQSFWWDHAPGSSVSLELIRPSYPERRHHFDSPFPWSGGYMIGFRYALAGRLVLVSEMPFAHVSGRTQACVDAVCMEFGHGTILGNPYLGAEIGPQGGIAVLRLGMRFPLQKATHLDTRDRYDNVAATFGHEGERVDRQEAFLPEVTSEMADVLISVMVRPTLRLRVLAGLSLLYHPDARGITHYIEKYQLHSRLGARMSWTVGGTRLGAGYLVRKRHTGVDAWLAPERRRVWEVDANASHRFGDWIAGLSLRMWRHVDHERDGDSLWEWRALSLMIERVLWRKE